MTNIKAIYDKGRSSLEPKVPSPRGATACCLLPKADLSLSLSLSLPKQGA